MGEKPASKHIWNLAARQQARHEVIWLQESFHQRQSEAAEGDGADLPALDHPSHVVIQVIIELSQEYL